MPNAAFTPQEMLAAYMAAEAELVSGAQETRINDRVVVRAELEWVQKGRKEWQDICSAMARGSGGLTFSTARFD